MRTNNKQLLTFALIIVIFCFLVIFIFTLPSFIQQFNLSSSATSNIGSTIGGITAPLIGIISSILLYLALTRQTQSNFDQRLKNESDIIFLLINQLDIEISNFYYKFNDGNKEIKYYGIEAINEFSTNLRYNEPLEDLGYTFQNFFEAPQLLLIIRSYELVEARIQISELSEEMKQLFQKKLDAFFDCKIKKALVKISDAIDLNENKKDEITNELQIFIKRRVK